MIIIRNFHVFQFCFLLSCSIHCLLISIVSFRVSSENYGIKQKAISYKTISYKQKNSSHYRKAWMISGLLQEKNILYKKFLSNPTLDNKFKFISYRNKFKKIKEASITQFFYKFCLYEKNCRKSWDIINYLMNCHIR